MLNGIFQRPYLNNNNLVRKKQDEEKNTSNATEREEQNNQQSKGLQYTEQKNGEQQVDWRQMRSQIQAQARNSQINQTPEVAPTKNLSGVNTTINIAQILKDFRNTAVAIGTPEDLKTEVEGYLSLVETQVKKDSPNTKLVKSNLKNASSILDNYISQTLNKDSKVVENWVDALFLQQVDFKYNEEDVNPQFLVKFPENKEPEKVEEKPVEIPTEIVQEQVEVKQENKTVPLVPQDKELKSLFLQSKKLAYANKPEKAIETFQKAMQRADEVGDVETKSKIFYEVGKIYDDHSYFNEALKSYDQSIRNTKDNNVKTKAHYSMAQIYDEVNQIQPALDHYFNSISFAGDADNLVAQSTSLTKMGNIFTDMFDTQGMDYFEIADGLAQQTKNSRIKGFVSASYGNAYEAFGENQKALKYYSDATKNYIDAEAPNKVAENYTKAADIMVTRFSNVSKAKGLLAKAQNHAKQTDNIELINEISDKLNSLELLS